MRPNRFSPKRIVFSKKEFLSWLKSIHPYGSAGLCNSPYHCPIAIFLKERDILYFRVSVTNRRVSALLRGRFSRTRWSIVQEDLPKWAREFVVRVDRTTKPFVTARRAQMILRGTPDARN